MRTTRILAMTAVCVVAISLLAVAPAQAATTLTVTPDSGLAGGQSVTLAGGGLTPGATAGWCQVIAAPEGSTPSADWCGVGVNGSGTVAADGSFGSALRLHRFLYVPALAAWVDCAAGDAQCAVGAGDVSDVAGTAVGLPVGFAAPPAPPAARGSISLSASTDVHPNEVVTVTGSGFRAGQVVDVFQCVPGTGAPADPSACGLLRTSVTADGAGAFATDVAIEAVVRDAPSIVGQGGTTYDCLAAPSGPCRVVAAEAVDFPGTAVAAPVSLSLPPPLPVIAPGSASTLESDGTSPVVHLPVTLSAPSSVPVTAQWTTVFVPGAPAGQADPASDYPPDSGTVTFAPGQTSATVRITTFGDLTIEPDEYVVVAFHHATGAAMGGFWGLGIVTITNDDPRPRIVPGAASVYEGESGTTALDVPVTLTNPSSREVTASWTTAFVPGAPAGQADPVVDYAPASGTVTFPPGETSTTVRIEITGDTDVEVDEYVVVGFHHPVDADMGGFWGLGIGTVLNDD